MDATNWALVDLSGLDTQQPTLTLEIEGMGTFTLSQFSMTHAVNEIPRAACLVAIGRDARSTNNETGEMDQAQIHQVTSFSNMKKATVWFEPQGQWAPGQTDPQWNGRKIIFDGWYMGFAWRRMNDKFQPVLHLVHWLAGLTFSSTMSYLQHPASTGSLITPIAGWATQDTGLKDAPIYAPGMVGFDDIYDTVTTDLWKGIKQMLYAFSENDFFHPPCEPDSGERNTNEPARDALKRFEGKTLGADSGEKDGDYKYAKPLAFNGRGVSNIEAAVSDVICHQAVANFAAMTFWDVLVGLCSPAFGLSIIPLIDRALLSAGLPAYNQEYITIDPGEYDTFESVGMLSNPLGGVGVLANFASFTGFDMADVAGSGPGCLGGTWPNGDMPVRPGPWMMIHGPPWLENLAAVGDYAAFASKIKTKGADSNSATTPNKDQGEPPEKTPTEIQEEPGLQELYQAYAHLYYLENILRGRGAVLSGKLRFDIAPGSIIRVLAKKESFSGDQPPDSLAVTQYAHVMRVSVNINSEGRAVGTILHCTHVRSEDENNDKDGGFATDEHPFFGKDIYNGAPLNATDQIGVSDDAWSFKGD
jgi:hypothetical protein